MFERPPHGTTEDLLALEAQNNNSARSWCPLQKLPPAPPPHTHSSLSFSLPKLEKRSLFLEQSSPGQYTNSDEEDGYASPEVKRRGTSVDDFLKGSELGKQVRVCTPALGLGWLWL